MIEKYNYEVNINDLVFRRAKKGDNYKELARLIYQTDEYIYPYWFNNNIEECEEFFKNKFDEEGFIFNYDNMYIAYNKKRKKILGLIIALDKSVNLNYDYSKIESINERYKIVHSIDKGFYGSIYKAIDLPENAADFKPKVKQSLYHRGSDGLSRSSDDCYPS